MSIHQEDKRSFYITNKIGLKSLILMFENEKYINIKKSYFNNDNDNDNNNNNSLVFEWTKTKTKLNFEEVLLIFNNIFNNDA